MGRSTGVFLTGFTGLGIQSRPAHPMRGAESEVRNLVNPVNPVKKTNADMSKRKADSWTPTTELLFYGFFGGTPTSVMVSTPPALNFAAHTASIFSQKSVCCFAK